MYIYNKFGGSLTVTDIAVTFQLLKKFYALFDFNDPENNYNNSKSKSIIISTLSEIWLHFVFVGKLV